VTRHHLETLRWLLQNGCPCDEDQLCRDAVTYMPDSSSSGSSTNSCYDILQCLLELGVLSDVEQLQDTLNFAGVHKKLAAAQWLRAHGAEWPPVLMDDQLQHSWEGQVLVWARSAGCTSPTAPAQLLVAAADAV
jgi:hypothetical protein